MDKEKRRKFAEILHQYGTDFDKMVKTEEFKDMTTRDMVSVYPEILDSYLQMNTALAQEESDWLQIRELHYFRKDFYFDVLAEEPDNTTLLKTGEKLKIGKELVLLLKDYEFSLLSKLSILNELYRTLHSDGVLKRDLSNRESVIEALEAGYSKIDIKEEISSKVKDKEPTELSVGHDLDTSGLESEKGLSDGRDSVLESKKKKRRRNKKSKVDKNADKPEEKDQRNSYTDKDTNQSKEKVAAEVRKDTAGRAKKSSSMNVNKDKIVNEERKLDKPSKTSHENDVNIAPSIAESENETKDIPTKPIQGPEREKDERDSTSPKLGLESGASSKMPKDTVKRLKAGPVVLKKAKSKLAPPDAVSSNEASIVDQSFDSEGKKSEVGYAMFLKLSRTPRE